MQVIKGNIWDKHTEGSFICITVNCTPNSRGVAIMGKGIALEAANRYSYLPILLGRTQIEFGEEEFFSSRSKRPQVFKSCRLITFPTKVIWKEKSNIILIQNSCDLLMKMLEDSKFDFIPTPIYLPKPGCSNGGLLWEEVEPAITEILDDRFIICDLN